MEKQTLVLGASEKTDRYSYLAIQKLVANNYAVKAIGAKEGEVLGVKIYTEKEKFENINTVTLYLSPKNQVSYYNYIISLKPKRVIFNPGTENEELQSLLVKNNIFFEIACTLVLLSIKKY